MTQIIHGDCLIKMKSLDDNSVDAIVTDPPYGLRFMGKEWDYEIPTVDIWKECFRVLKPGGHLLSFAGTRTQHRMAVNIEDAGFEIRDMIAWVYGSGFPKSHNIGKSVDKLQGNEREVVGTEKVDIGMQSGSMHSGRSINVVERDKTKGTSEYEGWGTALKPALEPITVARKPISEKTVAENCLKWGTGGINIDGCRVEGEEREARENNISWGINRIGENNNIRGNKAIGKTNEGRFPANFIHDGSEEVTGMFPESKSTNNVRKNNVGWGTKGIYGKGDAQDSYGHSDSGSAARFFYCAKASKSDRDGSTHPTIKPTKLMRYLCRLVTPLGGIVLDPFMGSGTTGKAAKLEGFNFIGIELEKESFEFAKQRINKVQKTLF